MELRKPASLALLAATILVAACGSDRDSPSPMQPQNTAPAMSAIANQAANQDTVVGPIEFGITDAESNVNALTLTASADSANLFPADGIVLAGTGPTRSITLTPFEARTGTATIAVLVTDPDGAATTRTFTVTVNARAASIKSSVLDTFAKAENAAPTTVGGYTFTQDADDPAAFAGLIPAGDE